MKAHEEVIEFMAAGPSTTRIAEFQVSPATRQRVADLLQREKTTGLSDAERCELDDYEALESLMNLTKARARQLLAHGH